MSRIIEPVAVIQGNLYELADQAFGCREMYKHIVGQAACHQGGILFVYFLHQRFHYLALQKSSPLLRRILYNFEKFVKSFTDHLFRYLVFHGCRRGSRSL